MLTKQQFQETSKRLNPVHGNIYQLKLLMLFLYRGVSNQYSFRLATEVKEAEKFDDLVFQYVEDGKIKYRLLQAKHKLDESKKITLDDLLGRNDNNYNLAKYFFSYREAKKNKLFQNGIIEDVIICTNIGFDLPDLKRNGIEIKNIEGLDYILDIKNSASKRYSFNRGLISKLKPILDKNLKHGNLISDEEIQDFLNHLVFAVNQPNEEELGKIIKNEIGEDLDLVTTENTYNKFFITMLNWLQGKERGRFLSYEEGKEFFEEAKRGLPILFNVRDPVSSFTGRIEQLDNLHKAMTNGGRAIVSQSVSISGLGGVGKSELARKYIREYSRDYDNKVIWINAESHNTLSESFRRLACDKLGISLKNRDGKEKDIKSIVEDVYRFFSKGKSLFIFDNAEKYRSQRKDDDGIDKFLPSLPENMNKPHILVTSRNTKWPKNVKICSLNTFTKVESVEFIKKALKMENSAQDEDIIKLAEKLQYFPLALQQAVAYIKVKNEELRNIGSGLRIKDYLETYERKTRELLNDSEFLDSDDNYTKATFTALKVQLDAIEKIENGNKAIEIINVIAYLAPENISIKMFLSLQSNKEELGSAIGLLKQYSIVNVEQEQVVLSVHRLVQQVTRLELVEQGKTEETIGKAFNLLKKNFPYGSNRLEDSSKKRELLPHCEALLSYLDGWLVKKPEDKQKVEDYLEQLIELMRDGYNDLGNYKRQKELLEKALPILEKRYSSNHVEVAKTLGNLSNTYGDLGDPNKQKELLERTLDIQERCYGSDHVEVARTLVNLGTAYKDLGNRNKAKELLERALVIKERDYGNDHIEIAKTLTNLGTTYRDLGDPNKQKELLERALDIKEKHYGSDHVEVAGTLGNLGTTYRDLGDYNKAKELLERALDIKEKHYGSDHVTVATTLGNLGTTYRDLGDYNKAKELLERSLHIDEKHYGSNHVEVARSLVHLGNAYGALGDSRKQKELIERALHIEEKHYGSNHVEVAKTLGNLCTAYRDLGDHNKAKELLGRALSILNNHSTSHPSLDVILENLYLVSKANCEQNKETEVSPLRDRDELLYRAVVSGEEEYVRGLLDSGADVNYQVKENGFTLLHIAAYNNYNGIAGALLTNGANVSSQDKDGWTPLHYAGNEDIVNILLKNGADVNAKGNEDNWTPLHFAAFKGYSKVITSLLRNGATIDAVTRDNATPLHLAAEEGHLESVKVLLGNQANIDFLTNGKNTPLYFAIRNSHISVANILLSSGAAVNIENKQGETLLHLAIKMGKLEIIKALLYRGTLFNVVPKLPDYKQLTQLKPVLDNEIRNLLNLVEKLFEAVKQGKSIEAEQCLRKEKAIVNARDNNGGTPLYWAIHNGHMNTARLLLENGADPSLVTNKGNTPLHMASSKGNNEIVRLLLKNIKPDKLNNFINAQTTVGKTSALHISSNIDVTRSLLQYGAVYNIKNKEGKTPLNLAKNDGIRKLLSFTNEMFEGVKNGNRQVISKLRNLEVDDFVAVTNARNDQGHTLLQVAIANKHRDIATELSKMLKNLAPSSSMESVNVAGPSRSHENLPS